MCLLLLVACEFVSLSPRVLCAGKTTVIAPLLVMILADGHSLVTLAVPSALLEQSWEILNRRFSSVLHKRVYTLEFDR